MAHAKNNETKKTSSESAQSTTNKGMIKPEETIVISEDFKLSNTDYETDLQKYLDNVSFKNYIYSHNHYN